MINRSNQVLLTLALACVVTACGDKSDGKADAVASAKNSEAAQLYTKNCKVCHAQGINGAPIFGNAKMWGPRIEKGIPTLTEHAINGFGLMPAKGGKTELSDEEVSTIVEYMVSQIN